MFQRVITRRLAGLIAVDLICVLAALWLAPALYPLLKKGRFVAAGYLDRMWWQMGAVAQLYLFYLAGLYDTEGPRSRVLVVTKTAIATGAMTAILLILYFFNYRQSRGVILLYWPFALLCVGGARALLGDVGADLQKNVMLVCNGPPTSTDLQLVQAAAQGAYRFQGVIVCNGQESDLPGDVAVARIGDPAGLEEIARREGVAEMVISAGCERHPELVRGLVRLSYEGVLLSTPLMFFERSLWRLPCEYLGETAFLLFHPGAPRSSYLKLRRVLDVGIAAVGLTLSFPVWIVAAALVKWSSEGPILVTEERVGLDGESFALIKFRTMRDNAEPLVDLAPAALDDPRVTAVGRLLRKTRIDELPQLANILKGEMSLIGPRPERRGLVEQFEREIPYYQERHAVRPGLTGWAQVKQGYVLGVEATREKLGYDLFYLKNQSLTLDLMILLMTIKALLWGGGQ